MDAILGQIKTLHAGANACERQQIQEQLRDVQRELASNFDLVWGLGSGHMQWALILIGIDLDIFKALSERSKPTGLHHFLDASGASPALLARLLRSMASFGLILETSKDTFAANRITKALAHPDVVGALPHVTHCHAMVAQVLPQYLREHKYQDLTNGNNLPFHIAMKTDLPPFEWLKQQPEQMKALGHAMRIERIHSWVESYPISDRIGNFRAAYESALLVDVGGGFGQQAAAFKTQVLPSSGRVVVQDIASTLAHAPAIDGIEFLEHDFFTPQPIRGAKYYYLRHILHDWNDGDSCRILNNIVPVMSSASRILIDEVILPDSNVPWQCAFMDLTMMFSLGGRERTQEEWASLLSQAGLRIEEVHTYDDVKRHSVIVAVPEALVN
ncbi:hypothetical protein E8E13_009927 [Curvularia kusanoi]|uniref:O-methyltransferase C-terminal domain-containing protein n=1 Tax=Curvularia kusanoi TaxID=90978 RepID=A0A9P4TF49_CURKU|nr:hypothetical protein E8E13_009927 [Curvularia kusanoi]